jgi:hypothetical protein
MPRARSNAVSFGAKYLLDVPLVAQDKSNTCWYAAACMVSYYFRPGPRLGVPAIWAKGDTTGIKPAEFVQLAQNEGLTNRPLVKYHTAAPIMYPAISLRQMLGEVGPLWCAGYWFGPGHIVVLTGIDGDTVHFNDPDGGVAKTNTVKWFNDKVARTVAGHLLCKDQTRS